LFGSRAEHVNREADRTVALDPTLVWRRLINPYPYAAMARLPLSSNRESRRSLADQENE
jgi:hypothetical protein